MLSVRTLSAQQSDIEDDDVRHQKCHPREKERFVETLCRLSRLQSVLYRPSRQNVKTGEGTYQG